MSYYEALGQRIAQIRERRGWSKSEMAKQLRRAGHDSFTPGRVHEMENGSRRVHAAEISDLCRLLRVPPWWLLGLTCEESAELDQVWPPT